MQHFVISDSRVQLSDIDDGVALFPEFGYYSTFYTFVSNNLQGARSEVG